MKIIKTIVSFLNSIYKNRYILFTLVIRDFKSRYLSSYIGLPWAFIQPAAYIFVIWFTFTVGIRGGTLPSGTPYIVYLITGIVPWLFISQTLIVSCDSINQYSYLLKKTNFPVSLIPIIKILSGMIVHVFLVVLMVVILLFHNIKPSIYWIQIFYYWFVMIFLFSGLGWFVSSINVFIKDMAHIVNIVVTMLFWVTPIFWPYANLHGNYRYVALLNPFFYITEGYRYTFVQKQWFFNFPEMTILFWVICGSIFVVGIFTFQKLKPDFGDVL